MATAAEREAARLEALDKKIEQMKAQRAQIAARKRAAEQKAKRSTDTRRKVLLGAWVMAQLEDPKQGPVLRAWLADSLPRWLTRDDDREILADFMAQAPQESPPGDAH